MMFGCVLPDFMCDVMTVHVMTCAMLFMLENDSCDDVFVSLMVVSCSISCVMYGCVLSHFMCCDDMWDAMTCRMSCVTSLYFM